MCEGEENRDELTERYGCEIGGVEGSSIRITDRCEMSWPLWLDGQE